MLRFLASFFGAPICLLDGRIVAAALQPRS